MVATRTVSRRRVIEGLGTLGVAGLATALMPTLARGDDSPAGHAIPFYGPHQAGIATPVQDRLHMAAFDVVTDEPKALARLLQRWTEASARMVAGDPVGDVNGHPVAPPGDTGEAIGLVPARLTITFGFGPSLFELDGVDRFGIADRRPEALAALPAFPGDALIESRCGGDLMVQACGDDPQVVFHAIRNLLRIGRGLVTMRWSQLGFGHTSSPGSALKTPRNLMGFLDGTNNLSGEDASHLKEHVWVSSADGPDWMAGGTYLVARRIRMMIEAWDRTGLGEQERVIGRHKVSGAPLGKSAERESVDLAALGGDGEPLIDVAAHIRLSAPEMNGGARMLRRGYAFSDGMDGVTGQLDAGLFFVAFQRDPRRQFVPVQQRLAESDLLNEYIKHTGSAIFAMPPGIEKGQSIGDVLFG